MAISRSARQHDRVRKQHSSELAQDYVEAVHKLSVERGGEPVRVKDLTEVFGVSHVSVIRALDRLDQQGLLTRSRREGIRLTRRGTNLARKAAERHALLVRFLRALGVGESQADADAEGAEHHLSEESLDAIRNFLGESG